MLVGSGLLLPGLLAGRLGLGLGLDRPDDQDEDFGDDAGDDDCSWSDLSQRGFATLQGAALENLAAGFRPGEGEGRGTAATWDRERNMS